MTHTTTRAIWTKSGRVIAPRKRLKVIPFSSFGRNDAWRLALLIDDDEQIVTISSSDLRQYTFPTLEWV